MLLIKQSLEVPYEPDPLLLDDPHVAFTSLDQFLSGGRTKSSRIDEFSVVFGAMTHDCTFDRGQQIEELSHIQSLVDHKRQARLHSSQDRLVHAVPQVSDLLVRLGQAGGNLGSAVAAFTRLLDLCGASELQVAIAQVLSSPSPHLGAVPWRNADTSAVLNNP